MDIQLNPMIKREHLAPSQARRAIEANSIGYLSGDLPFITLEIEGFVMDIKPGQCVPTLGKMVHITNRFACTGEVVLTYDHPPTADANTPLETGLHDYFCSAYVTDLPEGYKGGAGIRLEHGKVLVEWECNQTHGVDVAFYPGATVANIDARPAGFMDTGTMTPVNAEDGTLPGLTTIYGEYTNAMAAAWITASGYDETPRQLALRSTSGKRVLNGGDALFFVRGFENQYMELSFKLTDLGVYDYERAI